MMVCHARPVSWDQSPIPSAATARAELTSTRPEVPVEYRAVHGGAVKSFVEILQGTRMVVIGARGLGGLAGMLLGSVSDPCARHAACPMMVTRTTGRP